MWKTAKSELSHKLKEPIPKVTIMLPLTNKDTVIIKDAMTVIHALSVERLKTFGDLAEYYKEKHLEGLSIGNIVVDVFDKYDNISIKSAEREQRTTNTDAYNVYHVIKGRSIPPRKRFIGNITNKTSLQTFICDLLFTSVPEVLSINQQLLWL